MKKSTWWIVGLIIVVIIIIVVSSNSNQNESGPIKIGFISPQTGGAAAYGADTLNAALIAVKEINAAGAIDGRQIEIISEDGKCNAKDGLNAAQKLINVDKVKFMVTGSCSGELLGYTSLADQNKVLVLNTLASSPNVSGSSPYVFRNAPSDADGGKQLADIAYKSYKSVAVITEDTEYAQAIRKVFTDTFKASGGTIPVDEVFAPTSKDFRTILLKVKTANPQAIFLNVQAPLNGTALAKQARDLGLKSQFYLAYMSGPEYVTAGSFVEGSIIVDVPGLYSDKGATLLAKFKSEYNREPGYPFFVGSTYDAVYLMVDAIKNSGGDTAKAKDYLAGLKEYQGTIGTYNFDDKQDVVGIKFVVRKVTNQKTVEVTQ